MAGKPKYLTPEAKRAAREANVVRYNASAKRREAARRYRESGGQAEATARYRQSPKYAARRAAYTPEQTGAWTAIRYATVSGKVVRPKTCQHCGRRRRIEAHHHRGYAREHWLDVLWLCGTCHVAAHGVPKNVAQS